MLVLLGAMGALTSNMLTRSLLLATTGPTRRYILYNVFMRPVLGAVAAYVFVILALSGLLFQIEPDIAESTPPARSAPAVYYVRVANPPADNAQQDGKVPGEGTTEPVHGSTEAQKALVTITLSSQRQTLFAYFVFAFVCGFSADRILAKTLDQALQRLFTTAEKTLPTKRLEEETMD